MKLHEINTKKELAYFLGIELKLLTYILYKKKVENMYTSFQIPKKNGSNRQIHAPNTQLRSIQKKLAKEFYKYRRDSKSKTSHGFEEKRGIITNSKIHLNKKIVINIDLADFFESFHFGRVRGYFIKNKKFQLDSEIATILTQLCCYKGSLPQGSPCSPVITNMICDILDYRLVKIAKKYKVDYTRYADDLTFSTNDKKFKKNLKSFYREVEKEVNKSGFKLNEQKYRITDSNNRQIVTGLTVNQKINVDKNYYKQTRAMAHSLYKNSTFKINDEEGCKEQLEGRLNFINQIVRYNNLKSNNRRNFRNLTGKEKEYQKFLFYKYFFDNSKPLIIVEGKTDIIYLKSALKNMHDRYPTLIEKLDNGDVSFKIGFLNKTKRLEYFLGITIDGATAFKNIYNYYTGKHGCINYSEYFHSISERKPKNIVILIFDNEIKGNKDKPINNFIKYSSLDKDKLEENFSLRLKRNLYILIPEHKLKQSKEIEIEDLFDEELLNLRINGKTFSRNDKFDSSKEYGKHIFSQYVAKNYKNINFDNFIPLLDKICESMNDYENKKNTDQL